MSFFFSFFFPSSSSCISVIATRQIALYICPLNIDAHRPIEYLHENAHDHLLQSADTSFFFPSLSFFIPLYATALFFPRRNVLSLHIK